MKNNADETVPEDFEGLGAQANKEKRDEAREVWQKRAKPGAVIVIGTSENVDDLLVLVDDMPIGLIHAISFQASTTSSYTMSIGWTKGFFEEIWTVSNLKDAVDLSKLPARITYAFQFTLKEKLSRSITAAVEDNDTAS